MTQKQALDRVREDEFFHLSNRLLFKMFKTTNIMHTVGTAWTQSLNLTTQQWSVIGALSRPGFENGTGIGALTEFLQVSRQNLAGLLERLENQGITRRVANPNDGRARLVQLTPEGWKIWDTLVPMMSQFYERALDGFSAEDITKFLVYIDRLQENLQKT
ncbi:MAG: MarR family transcriptional regulator [Rhizobiales bacterium]|nr:MarR family transcriptional regulator [Hyphomicrobiales bacterium]